jgi:predicted Zn-dependent protease
VIDMLEAEARERPDDPAIWQLLVDAYTGTKNAIGVYRSRAEVYFMFGSDDKAIEQLKLASNQTRDNYPLNAKIQKRMREMQQAKADMKT